MAAIELGTAYVTMTYETAGLAKKLSKEFAGAKSLGRDAGRDMGREMAKAFKAEEPDLKGLTDKVTLAEQKVAQETERASRLREAAKKRVADAEAALATATAKAAEAVRAAEGRVATAQEKRATAQAAVTAAQAKYSAAVKATGPDSDKAADAALRLQKAESDLARSGRDVQLAQQKLKSELAGTSTSTAQVRAATDKLSQAEQKLKVDTAVAAQSQQKLQDELKASKTALADARKGALEAGEAAKRSGGAFAGFGARVREGLRGNFKGVFSGAVTEARESGRKAAATFTEKFRDQVRAGAPETAKPFAGALSSQLSGLMPALGVTAAVGFMGGAVKKAGELEQTLGATDTIFKGSAAQIREWGKAASETVGLSANEYGQFANLLGAQLKNLGTPMDQVAGKADDMVKKGADLASMFGGTTSQAVEALSSALKGEMDPIEKYGISLNETTLKATALQAGLLKPVKDEGQISAAMQSLSIKQRQYAEAVKKNGAESIQAAQAKLALTKAENALEKATAGKVPDLDAQTKAQAVQIAITKQSADATGNFARESDTLQHKQQVLAARAENASAALGSALLPAATAALDLFLKFTPQVGLFGEALKGSVRWVSDNVNWLGPLVGVLGAGVAGYVAFTNAQKAYVVVSGTVRAAMALMRGEQIALNAAMYMNPIGLVVAAVMALIAGLVIAYNKIGWFKDAVNGAWQGIKNAAAGFVSWWQSNAAPLISAAFKKVGDAGLWLWHNAIQPAFDGVATGASWLYASVLKPVFDGAVALVRGVGTVFSWLWGNAVSPAFSAISTAVIWLVDTILRPTFTAAVWFFSNYVVPVYELMAAVAVFAFGKIAQAAVWMWNNGLRVVFGAVVLYFQAVVAPAFRWLYAAVVLPIMHAIGSLVRLVVAGVVAAWRGLVGVYQNVVAPVVRWLYANVIGPSMRQIGAVVKLVIAGVVAVWRGLVGFYQGVLAPAFRWLYNNIIRPVMDSVGSKIQSVWLNVVKPVFDALRRGVTHDVPNAFRSGVESVKHFWGALIDVAKQPVRFVVDTIINQGLIGNFNKAARAFGTKEMPEVQLPPGFATGGWTGPGAKYDVAGIVHADEFVVKKDSRRRFEEKHPGVLDYVNQTGELPSKEYLDPPKINRRGVAYAGTPSGPGAGLWGSVAQSAANTGKVYVRPDNVIGVNLGDAAKAWMGRSALDVRVGSGGPQISAKEGPTWGYALGDTNGNITVNPVSTAAFSPGMKLAILAHEIGHTLSLNHNNSGNSIMDWAVGNAQWPTGEDEAGFQAVYGAPGGSTQKFANPGGGGTFVNPLAAVGESLIGKMTAKFPAAAAMADMAVGFGRKIIEQAVSKIGDVAGAMGEAVKGAVNDTKLTAWITEALSYTGDLNAGNVSSGIARAKKESGGDPGAVNNWDSNAKAGTPSKGLMQVIDPTFQAYKDRGKYADRGIFDPVANILASIGYSKARYGSIRGGWDQPGGYAEGGLVKPALYDRGGMLHKGLQLIDHQRTDPDVVLTSQQWNDVHTITESVSKDSQIVTADELRAALAGLKFVLGPGGEIYLAEAVAAGNKRLRRAF